MYDQHLNLSGSGQSWRMLNPLRSSPNDPAVAAATAIESNDRLPTRTAGVGVLTALLVGALLCLLAAPAAAIGPAIAAGIIAAFMFHRHYRTRADSARRDAHSLDSTLGPRVWSRGSIAHPLLGEVVDDAAAAAHTVSSSMALANATLGDPTIVAAELRESLWEAVQMAAAADSRYRKLSAADDAAGRYNAHELTQDARSVAETSSEADLNAIRQYVSAFEALAERVTDLDARTAATVITPQLHSAAAEPAPAVDVSALQRLTAHVLAAEDLQQHGGYTPDTLDRPQ